jgi:hypothetical protein
VASSSGVVEWCPEWCPEWHSVRQAAYGSA